MQTLERPANGHTNGHARFHDADFAEVLRRNDLPIGREIHDPIESEGPIQVERKPLKSVSFQKLLDDIAREEEQPKQSDRPAFPLHALPPALRNWVEATAAQTQTAPEAAAMLGLAASSAALAGRVRILGQAGKWHPLNLYLGVLTGGDRCDEVMSAAIAPLRELEFEELEAAAIEQAKDRVYKREEPRALRKERQRLEAAGDPQGLEWIEEKLGEAEACEVRPAPRRILDEVTARSLRHQLAQLDRIACFSPTGDIFRQIAGRSTASRQRLVDTLDAGYSGRDFVADGPRGRQTPVNRPAITIASLVDRSVVSSIAGQRECHARALLSQFVFVSPESRVGSRKPTPLPGPEEVEAHRAALCGLVRGQGWQSSPSPAAAAYREGIRSLAVRKHVALTPLAEMLGQFSEWEAEVESQLGPRGSLAPIGDWVKHLLDTTYRLAGILHCWSTEGPVVSPETVAAAIEIARWLVPQAAVALEKLGAADDPCTDRERALLRYARAAGEFSLRDAWQHVRRIFPHTSALRRALAQLVRRGYLRVAREGEKMPRRFALVVGQVANLSKKERSETGPLSNLSYEGPIPTGRAGKRARRKARRAAEMAANPSDSPLAGVLDEITKRTQASLEVLLSGGEAAVKNGS